MADGITRIAVEGFKSIVNRQEIEIAPLTILAGANSSGKSSIMQPLLMLKQTLEQTFDPGPLWMRGPNVIFTSTDQFSPKTNIANGERLFKVEISVPRATFGITFSKALGSNIEVLEEYGTFGDTTGILHPTMSAQEIRSVVGKVFDKKEPPDLPWEIRRNRFLLGIVSRGFSYRVVEWIEPYITGMMHVSGRRGSLSRTYSATAVGPTFPGTFENYTASMIAHWQSEKSENAHALNRDLRYIGLTQAVLAKRLSEAEIDLQVDRIVGRSDDLVSIADVGFGVSQTLPVLVALRAAGDGQLVYLEEPEIHLHPRAQVKLADILADAAKRGVRVVAETHSSLLLRAIQTLIAKEGLPADLVKLHWFSRDSEGVTQIKSVTPDENGAFGDWPEDFGDVALQSEKDYLDAVESKLAR